MHRLCRKKPRRKKPRRKNKRSIVELTRAQRALLKSLYTRHGRKKSARCVCEGLRAVGELFAARPDLVEFTVCTGECAGKLQIPGDCFIVSPETFSELAGTVNAQGILCVARIPEEPAPDTPCRDRFILALDRIGDPGNFGTICRTARAAGLTELWFTRGSVDPYGDKAVRAALGAQFSMKLRSFIDLETLRRSAAAIGFGPVYLTDPHQGESCFAAAGLYERTVVVIGCESTGVGDLDGAPRVMIPMPGKFESLNAAQAATIFLFEYVRRQESAERTT